MILITVSCKKESLSPIQNGISPNGDGINDTWVIPFENANVTIFDNTNAVLYKSNPYLNNWDASGLSDGTYFYSIISNGVTYNGFVTVIR